MTWPSRLPRPLHPGAWWIWALGMATAASRTTNLLLLVMILAVVAFVVSTRRTEAPWARGFRYYLWMALAVIGLRVVFRALLDGQAGTHVLFTLPEIPLPEVSAGIRLGGPVAAEGLMAALRDGLRLAALLVCLGAANVLANPKRLLASLPSALHELGVAVTVALSVAPQLVESAQRVHRARRLRSRADRRGDRCGSGGVFRRHSLRNGNQPRGYGPPPAYVFRGDTGRRMHMLRDLVVPVLSDSLDRSLLLAAAMDSRGYGRTLPVSRSSRVTTGALVLGGLSGVCVGVYALLDSGAPRALGAPVLAVGLFAAVLGFGLGGRRVRTTRYRPDPWGLPEWAVSLCGATVGAALMTISRSDPLALNPSLQDFGWPQLPPAAAIAVLVGLLPAWLAPPPGATPAILLTDTLQAPGRVREVVR